MVVGETDTKQDHCETKHKQQIIDDVCLTAKAIAANMQNDEAPYAACNCPHKSISNQTPNMCHSRILIMY